jgi:hypothetical protein
MRDESRKALRTIGRSGGPFRLSAVQRCSRSSGADNVPSPIHKLLRDANFPKLHLFQSLGEARGADTPHVSIQRKAAMRAHRMFLSLAIAVGCGITLPSAAFSQEYRGTWQQQQACTPDVWRLCGGQIPDVNRIVACLRRNTPQLSDRCRAVFEQADNAPSRREDRVYGQRRYDRDYGPRPYEDRTVRSKALRQGLRAKALRL